MPFDIEKDLTYIAKMAMFPQCIAVRTESPFKTLGDLLAFAKANPKKLKAGTPGAGTHPFMAVHMLNDDAKVQITVVAFAGGGQLVTIPSGDTWIVPSSPSTCQNAGLRGQDAHSRESRRQTSSMYPDIPTVTEQGYKKTIVQTGICIVGPKGLPPAVVKKWEEVAQATLKEPGTMDAVKKFDFVVDYRTGEEFKKNS